MITPKIRFKDHSGDNFPEWNFVQIGNIAEIVGGGTPSTSISKYWNGPIQWLTPTEINSKYVHSSKRTITFSGLSNSSAKLLPTGALLLTTRATIGACSINNFDGPICTNQGFQSLICKDMVNNEFAYYAITLDSFQKSLIKHSSGSTFLEISPKNLKKLLLPVPDLREQEKIASFFSSIDQKIDLAERKLEILRTQKKGIIQVIFDKGVQNQWKTYYLSELLQFQNGINADRDAFGSGTKLISVSEVLDSKPIRYDDIRSSVEVDEDIQTRFSVSYGDVLFQRSSEIIEDAGTANIYIDKDRNCVFGGFVIRGKKIADYDPIFLKEVLRAPYVRRQMMMLAQGAQHINIGQDSLAMVSVQLPSIEDQQRYTNVISGFDLKIDIQERKIKALKEIKKALLQKMFV